MRDEAELANADSAGEWLLKWWLIDKPQQASL